MNRSISAAINAVFLMFVAASSIGAVHANSLPSEQGVIGTEIRSGHVAVNGLNYYYEIQGEGEPLLLLHGGLGQIEMFEPLLPEFTRRRQIIAVDLQGHGRTPLGDRPINLVDIGNDLAEILKKFGYQQVDVLGYSFGGGAALRLAIQHPDLVRRLAVVSAPYAQDGFFPEMLPQQAQVGAAMAEFMKDTPMYKSSVAVAPNPDEFPKLLDAMGEYMRKPYNWAEDIKKLKGPVMLVYGDSDMIRPEHIVSFYQLLGGGLKDAGWQREHMSHNRLAILPDLTHYEMFLSFRLLDAVLPFLNWQSGAESWKEQVDAASRKN
jgi:pimeloyl-ACP methyl ester carboxylesterase